MEVAALASCRYVVDWNRLRLVAGTNASELERTVLVDARALFEAATGSPIAIVDETAEPGAFDVFVGTPESSSQIRPIASEASGAYHVSGSPPLVTISGADAEGARNGLYVFMEELGFRFFRDGAVVPELRGSAALELELEALPAFRFRGDMIWDNYLGPRRYCASVWNEEDWERALLYMARNRLNFLEFYPPLEHVLDTVFPEAKGLHNGSVLKSDAKHALAKKVLARARALGIECMYVLSYGSFPEPVRALYPTSNGATVFCIAKLTWLRTRVPSLDAYARAARSARGAFSRRLPAAPPRRERALHEPAAKAAARAFLSRAASLDVLREVRAGALTMMEHLDASSSRFVRDFVDLYTWLALRQAQTFEADAYLSHVEGEAVTFEAARATWSALHAVLEQVPELGIVEAARSVAREGILADGAEDTFWTLGCNFYRGYPLVMSPEAVELVYLDQLDRLETLVKDAHERGEVAALEEPGWFWHDFPDASWADTVRKLPSEDAARFESVMRERLRRALSEPSTPPTARKLTLDPTLLELALPEPRDTAMLP